MLTVRDHGPGFHEEDLPFVFDRFHRARDARSKPGSGLGLAIVRQAAEAPRRLREASNAPGGGALMRISFGRSVLSPSRSAALSDDAQLALTRRGRRAGAAAPATACTAQAAPRSRGSPSRSSIVCRIE